MVALDLEPKIGPLIALVQSLERGRAGATPCDRGTSAKVGESVWALATAHGGEDGDFIAWGESGAVTVSWLLPVDPDPRAAEDDGEALAIGCTSLFEQLTERIGVDAVGGPCCCLPSGGKETDPYHYPYPP